MLRLCTSSDEEPFHEIKKTQDWPNVIIHILSI